MEHPDHTGAAIVCFPALMVQCLIGTLLISMIFAQQPRTPHIWPTFQNAFYKLNGGTSAYTPPAHHPEASSFEPFCCLHSVLFIHM